MGIYGNEYIAYVGTYTNGEKEGIYAFSLDYGTGRLERLNTFAKAKNPSYLAVEKNGRVLYAVFETDEYMNKSGGAVGAFSINRQTASLELINYQNVKGRGPCHLCIDSSNKYLFTANYNDGTLSALALNRDGSIGTLTDLVSHIGSGSNKERQEMPHVHFVAFTPENKYLCAVDLGIDMVKLYDFNLDKGTLLEVEDSSIAVKSGAGPRHMAFHPNGRFLYIVTELSSEIVALKYSSVGVLFEELQWVSTVPEKYKGKSFCGAIYVHPKGNYLYVSNRGHNSITAYRIDQASGKLSCISYTSTLGDWPRDFAIDPTGKYIFVANQNSDEIVSFLINERTGELEPSGNVAKVPSPTCIKFSCIRDMHANFL